MKFPVFIKKAIDEYNRKRDNGELKLKRIDRYIIKQFLGTFIFTIALIIAICVVFDINEKIDKFLNPDVSMKAIIFDYYMNFIPYFINLFSPLFTFISVIFFTSSSGISTCDASIISTTYSELSSLKYST